MLFAESQKMFCNVRVCLKTAKKRLNICKRNSSSIIHPASVCVYWLEIFPITYRIYLLYCASIPFTFCSDGNIVLHVAKSSCGKHLSSFVDENVRVYEVFLTTSTVEFTQPSYKHIIAIIFQLNKCLKIWVCHEAIPHSRIENDFRKFVDRDCRFIDKSSFGVELKILKMPRGKFVMGKPGKKQGNKVVAKQAFVIKNLRWELYTQHNKKGIKTCEDNNEATRSEKFNSKRA